MKTLFPFCFIFFLILFGSCEESINQVDEQLTEDIELKKGSKKMVELTEDEINGILLMREEEKLARDVYQQFYNVYGPNVFMNIAIAEQKHMDAMLHLIEFYELTDPVIEATGEFTDEGLKTLYDELILSATNLESALEACIEIEEKFNADLSFLMEQTEVKNLDRVYAHHLMASENHLRAFNLNVDKLDKVPGNKKQNAFK